MTPQQKIASLFLAAGLLFLVLELVRRRALRMEYSWIWFLALVVLFALLLNYDLTLTLTNTIGAVSSTTTIFIFAFFFLVLISIHFSVKISRLTNQVKKLTQQVAILEAEGKPIGQDASAAPKSTSGERSASGESQKIVN